MWRNDRRLWLVWGGLTAFLLAVGAAIPLSIGRMHRINEAGADQIEPGMTRAEVERILRVPPGDYKRSARTDFFAVIVPITTRFGPIRFSHTFEAWASDHGHIAVGYDKEGRVVDSTFTPPFRVPPQNLLERLEDVLLDWLP